MSKNDITFHYTNPLMVRDIIGYVPIERGDIVLDAGSGKNKVWYNNLEEPKFECELEDGCNFFDWDDPVDWVIGNPPFHVGFDFTEHACKISNKGIAFLGNINFFNHYTPRRLEIMKGYGFELQYIHIVSDARWFGRYYFMIFEKKEGILSWNTKVYKQ